MSVAAIVLLATFNIIAMDMMTKMRREVREILAAVKAADDAASEDDGERTHPTPAPVPGASPPKSA